MHLSKFLYCPTSGQSLYKTHCRHLFRVYFDPASFRFQGSRWNESWGGHAIYVRELNPHFQIVFFPCSKFDKVWVKHKNLRFTPVEELVHLTVSVEEGNTWVPSSTSSKLRNLTSGLFLFCVQRQRKEVYCLQFILFNIILIPKIIFFSVLWEHILYSK